MEADKETSRKQKGRRPKVNRAVHRYGIKLNDDENAKFTSLFLQSGMNEKAKFIKSMLFGNVMKTVKIDKAAMDYYARLTNFYAQFQAIGNNYNQTVKAVKTNFSEKRALALLYKLEKTTVELVVLSKKIIELTREFEEKMVAKISHGASLYGAVIYNQEKVSEGTARIIGGNRMITDMTGNPQNIMRQTLLAFEPYLAANIRTEKPVLHISLNPSPDDKLTDEQFASLARDYMEKMNYGSQPCIVYMHEDTGRRHIHIVSVCVDEEGRKISDSYEHRRSMAACRELEIKYGLKNITGERQEQDGIFLKKVEYGKDGIKHQISNVLKNVSDYKFRTFGEYSALLSCFNVEAKTVKGEGIDGRPFNGIVYSATDDTGRAVSAPFKSSLFGKPSGYEGLNKKMARNEKALKEGKYAPMIRGAIAAAMRVTRDREKFISLLRSSGIDVVFRENAEGRLYGATFIDHNRKEVYNGSVLGKEFSANVFHKLFNENSPTIDSQDNKIAPKTEQESGQSFNRENHSSDIFGIFDFPAASDGRDYEEEAFQRQVKRRRKKKQQRRI